MQNDSIIPAQNNAKVTPNLSALKTGFIYVFADAVLAALLLQAAQLATSDGLTITKAAPQFFDEYKTALEFAFTDLGYDKTNPVSYADAVTYAQKQAYNDNQRFNVDTADYIFLVTSCIIGALFLVDSGFRLASLYVGHTNKIIDVREPRDEGNIKSFFEAEAQIAVNNGQEVPAVKILNEKYIDSTELLNETQRLETQATLAYQFVRNHSDFHKAIKPVKDFLFVASLVYIVGSTILSGYLTDQKSDNFNHWRDLYLDKLIAGGNCGTDAKMTQCENSAYGQALYPSTYDTMEVYNDSTTAATFYTICSVAAVAGALWEIYFGLTNPGNQAAAVLEENSDHDDDDQSIDQDIDTTSLTGASPVPPQNSSILGTVAKFFGCASKENQSSNNINSATPLLSSV